MSARQSLERLDRVEKPDPRAVAGKSGEVDPDGLRDYMQTVTASPPLDRDEELIHAKNLAEARRALARMFCELPSRCRIFALNGNGPYAKPEDKWPLEQIEATYRRVIEFASTNEDPALKTTLGEIRHQKRRLDGARDTLIHANLRFVPYVVRQLGLYGTHFMDLIQEGNVGLMMAVDRFEPERGHRFATYAFWWIRQAITRSLTESFHLVKFSAYTRERVRRIQKVSRELESRLDRRPTPEEIASEMNLPVGKVRDLMVASQTPKPLENTSENRPEAGVLGVVADKRALNPLEDTLKRERHEQVLSALDRLSPREKQVIRLRFGIGFDTGYTLREVGEMLRISRERVRQIETDAIIKIQEWHDIPSRRHRRPLPRRNGSRN
jgi:RNA polymerase sigma factor (sigma-70 family)